MEVEQGFIRAFADVIKNDESFPNSSIFAVSGSNGANELIGLKNSGGEPLFLGTDTIDVGYKGAWAAYKTKTFFPKQMSVRHARINATDALRNFETYKYSGLRGDLIFYPIDDAFGGMGAFIPATSSDGKNNGNFVFDLIRTKATEDKNNGLFNTKNPPGEMIDPVIAVYDWMDINRRL
jgi:hypothetical protein